MAVPAEQNGIGCGSTLSSLNCLSLSKLHKIKQQEQWGGTVERLYLDGW